MLFIVDFSFSDTSSSFDEMLSLFPTISISYAEYFNDKEELTNKYPYIEINSLSELEQLAKKHEVTFNVSFQEVNFHTNTYQYISFPLLTFIF